VKDIRILIVEDELVMRRVMRHVLERMGHVVVGVAGDVLQALEMARSLHPDLVLMDVHARAADGIAAAWSMSQGCRAPLVVLSKDSSPETVEEALQAGAVAFLSKPVSTRVLAEALSSVVGEAMHVGRHR
jgi:CheY-like chemotaxis protein